jgi:hypothetical protein
MEFSTGSSSAHCLRFDEPFFSAFSIESPFLKYEMKINLATASAEKESYE